MTFPAYARRRLQFLFRLGQGDFGFGGQFNTIIVADGDPVRAWVQVENAILQDANSMTARIYGMTLAEMNRLTVAGTQFVFRNNVIVVRAGSEANDMRDVFNGEIIEAYPDFREQANAAFVVVAKAGVSLQMKPVPPISFRGATTVDTAMRRILEPAGYRLNNLGVDVTLSNPYFAGTVGTQMNKCLQAAGCDGSLSAVRDEVTIWPRNGTRAGESLPVISPATGMIGYPEFEQLKIRVRSVLDPEIISRGTGTFVKVESQIKAANSRIHVVHIGLSLASEALNGPWEMMITGTPQDISPQPGSTAPPPIQTGPNGLPIGADT